MHGTRPHTHTYTYNVILLSWSKGACRGSFKRGGGKKGPSPPPPPWNLWTLHEVWEQDYSDPPKLFNRQLSPPLFSKWTPELANTCGSIIKLIRVHCYATARTTACGSLLLLTRELQGNTLLIQTSKVFGSVNQECFHLMHTKHNEYHYLGWGDKWYFLLCTCMAIFVCNNIGEGNTIVVPIPTFGTVFAFIFAALELSSWAAW